VRSDAISGDFVISGSRVTDDPYSVDEVDGLARARGVHLELDAVASGMALLAKFEPGSTSSMRETSRPGALRSSSISPERSCGWRERPA
jgi:hypothetical protein